MAVPDKEPSLCALPGCSEARQPIFLGWRENDAIWSAYCEEHGPHMKMKRCSECGTELSGKHVWPDGIQPVGVSRGELGALTIS
jgi:hypothetical protein